MINVGFDLLTHSVYWQFYLFLMSVNIWAPSKKKCIILKIKNFLQKTLPKKNQDHKNILLKIFSKNIQIWSNISNPIFNLVKIGSYWQWKIRSIDERARENRQIAYIIVIFKVVVACGRLAGFLVRFFVARFVVASVFVRLVEVVAGVIIVVVHREIVD